MAEYDPEARSHRSNLEGRDRSPVIEDSAFHQDLVSLYNYQRNGSCTQLSRKRLLVKVAHEIGHSRRSLGRMQQSPPPVITVRRADSAMVPLSYETLSRA